MKRLSTSSISTARLYLRRGLFVAAGVVAFSAMSQPANAQDFPSDPFSNTSFDTGPSSNDSLDNYSPSSPSPAAPAPAASQPALASSDSLDNYPVEKAPERAASEVATPRQNPEPKPAPVQSPVVPVKSLDEVASAGPVTSLDEAAAAKPGDVGLQVLNAVPEAPVAEVEPPTSLDGPDSVKVGVAPIKGGGRVSVDAELGDVNANVTGTAKNNGDLSATGTVTAPVGDAVLGVVGNVNNDGPASLDAALTVPVADNANVIVGDGTGGTILGATLGNKDDVNGSIKTNLDTGKTTGTVNFPGESLETQLTGSTGGQGGDTVGIKVSTSGGADQKKPLDTAALGTNIDQATADYKAGQQSPEFFGQSFDDPAPTSLDDVVVPVVPVNSVLPTSLDDPASSADSVKLPTNGNADLASIAGANPDNAGLQLLNTAPDTQADVAAGPAPASAARVPELLAPVVAGADLGSIAPENPGDVGLQVLNAVPETSAGPAQTSLDDVAAASPNDVGSQIAAAIPNVGASPSTATVLVAETGGADLKSLAEANPNNTALQILNATPETLTDPLVSGDTDSTLLAAKAPAGAVSDTPDPNLVAGSPDDRCFGVNKDRLKDGTQVVAGKPCAFDKRITEQRAELNSAGKYCGGVTAVGAAVNPLLGGVVAAACLKTDADANADIDKLKGFSDACKATTGGDQVVVETSRNGSFVEASCRDANGRQISRERLK
jgi:hypothetical protein